MALNGGDIRLHGCGTMNDGNRASCQEEGKQQSAEHMHRIPPLLVSLHFGLLREEHTESESGPT